MPALDDATGYAYLELLGVDVRPGEVDAAALAVLQRAHVESVPYETVDIVRGRPPGIEPIDCAGRVLAGRGGYCYHLNGAFATLLEWLGADVTRHLAGVQGGDLAEPPGPNGNHLGLTVRTPDGEDWLVDAGLGTGPAQPFRLEACVHEDDGFRYELLPSPLAPGGWRFEHDPLGGWVRFDVAAAPASTADFLAMHSVLSTTRFARVVTAQRRRGPRLEILRGCVYTEIEHGRVTAIDVEHAQDWWELLIGRFGLAYGDLDAAERATLWRHVRSTHDAWNANGRQ
jgi:N-hydroxyarylamine O-acetyltransferase